MMSSVCCLDHIAPTCNAVLYGSTPHLVVGYEPAGLTVHPPQNDRGWVHFFRMGV